MSDEEENYDDFMMSDDDGVVEMEDEDDGDKKEEEVTSGSELQSLEDLYEIGIYYGEEQDWTQAQNNLYKVIEITRYTNNGDALRWRYKSLLQILHNCSLRMHYNDLPTLEEVLPACEELVENFKIRDEDKKIWSEIFALPRGLLFNDNFEPSTLAKIELQLKCIVPFLSDEQMQMRHKILSIWQSRLKSNKILESHLNFLESQIFRENSDGKELDNFQIEVVNLVLQCYIYEFISNGKISSMNKFSKFLDEIEVCAKNSISISQNLGIMLQLPLTQSINQILQKSRNNKSLQRLFWLCLKQVEEIGGPQKFNPRLEEFILCGFIFCNMLLFREDNKVNPFDLEQVKVGRELKTVQTLQACYSNFVHLNLSQLCLSVNSLPPHAVTLLDVLVKRIYYVAQVAKLWESLAPLFSCISLQDLQRELQLGEIPLTRDYVLKILMTSILRDRAAVYYKLDLKRDLVYFGNNNKVPLSLCAKHSLNLNQLERSNNIGLWHSTRRLRHTESNGFFQDLQRQRVGDFESDSFQSRSTHDILIHELALKVARLWS